MKLRDLSAIIIVVFALLLLASCSSRDDSANMANPASLYCGEQGGKTDIRKDADGNETGYCQFDDGSECEEWSYFRGECKPGEFPASTQLANPASVYCDEQGGKLEIREHEDGGQYGVCIFDDGSECEEWAYFRGECAPGDN
jgi:putative hemolysin